MTSGGRWPPAPPATGMLNLIILRDLLNHKTTGDGQPLCEAGGLRALQDARKTATADPAWPRMIEADETAEVVDARTVAVARRGLPRSQTLRVRDVVRTCRRHGRASTSAKGIVSHSKPRGSPAGKMIFRSRGAVEYRYRQGREIVAKLKAAAAGWASVRRTVESWRCGGDPMAGLSNYPPSVNCESRR